MILSENNLATNIHKKDDVVRATALVTDYKNGKISFKEYCEQCYNACLQWL